MSRRHDPVFLWPAISRIASIDSCFAESMKAHVLTTSTSAAAGSSVSSWPAPCARPSITSESTRFFGQPSEMRPIFMKRPTPHDITDWDPVRHGLEQVSRSHEGHEDHEDHEDHTDS